MIEFFIEEIQDVCDVGDGAHASIKRVDSFDGIPYYTSKNFKNDGLDVSKLDFISESSYLKHFGKASTKVVKPIKDDILFSIIGSIGVPYVVPNNKKIGLSSSVSIFRPKENISTKYLYYWMKSSSFQQTVDAVKSGSAQGFLSLGMLKRLPVMYPPLPTQKKIAAILSAYDDLIENNNRRIALLEKMAEELYKEWFVRMRFPGFESAKFEKGIPEGWDLLSIGDICIKVTDGAHTSPKDFENGKPMASVKDMISTGFKFDSMRSISDVDFEKLKKSDCHPLIGDILIAKDGSYLKHSFVWDDPREVVILSSIAILRPDTELVKPYFLSVLLKQKSTKDMMGGYVSGSALPRIILKDFKKMKLLIPTTDLMISFDEVFVKVYQQIRGFVNANENLKNTRDRLLTRLISGKLSVENLDVMFPKGMVE